MTDSYNRDEVIAFWRSTGLEDKRKRREIEKLAQLTGSHTDHIKPLKLGGPDLWFNLQVLSGTRNTSKGANFPELDRREYEKRWTALPDDYRQLVQSAIDGNPQPVPNLFERVTRTRPQKSKGRTRHLSPMEKALKALEDAKRIRFSDPNYKGLMQSQRVVDGLAEHKKNKSHWLNGLSALAAIWSLVFTLCLLTVQEKPQTRQLMAQTSMAFVIAATTRWALGKTTDQSKQQLLKLGVHEHDIPL